MSRHILVHVFALAGLALGASSARAASYVFTAINPSGYATPTGINDRGVVVGNTYIDSGNTQEGFVYAHGTFTATSGPQSEQLLAISPRGLAVGLSSTTDSPTPPTLVLYRPGAMRSHAIKLSPGDSVQPVGINASREIAGTIASKSFNISTAFLRSNGRNEYVNPPGALGSYGTAINDAGTLLGYYMDTQTGHYRGFTYKGGTQGVGTYAVLNLPTSVDVYPVAITEGGTIVGYTADATETVQGFVLRNGQSTTLSFPGTTQTYVSGIGGHGEIVGTFVGAGQKYHGFLFYDGVYHQIDAPQSTATLITAINAEGSIIGQYDDQQGTNFGFVAVCPSNNSPPCTK